MSAPNPEPHPLSILPFAALLLAIALNRERFAGFHLAFFIFVVSNIGGALFPIGPPLLLGYLKGVPFWWVAHRCWQPWGITLGAVLVCFYFFDRINFRPPSKETP